MTIGNFINCLLTSYGYNRNEQYMVNLISECINRATHNMGSPNSDKDLCDDADILYGSLVVAYGDYGTSPRYGWLNKENEQIILDVLEKKQLEYEELIEMSEEE